MSEYEPQTLELAWSSLAHDGAARLQRLYHLLEIKRRAGRDSQDYRSYAYLVSHLEGFFQEIERLMILIHDERDRCRVLDPEDSWNRLQKLIRDVSDRVRALSIRTRFLDPYRFDPDGNLKQAIMHALTRTSRHCDMIQGLLKSMSEQAIEQVNARVEMKKLARIFEPELDERGARVTVDGTWTGITSRAVLQTISFNLVENALRHSAITNPQIAIVVEGGVQLTRGNSGLMLSVSDDGAGVSNDALPHIFRSGFSSSDSSGLGLTISRRLAEIMGGSLGLSLNGPPRTTFTLVLPAVAS